jgi:hypothetical protein
MARDKVLRVAAGANRWPLLQNSVATLAKTEASRQEIYSRPAKISDERHHF